LKTYQQLLEERSTLNSAKQQIYHLNPEANVEEINKQIQNLSNQIRSLEFNNIKHETICDDIIELNQSRVPEMLSFEEFKTKNEHQVMKTIVAKLVEIDEIPMGVYAQFICETKRSFEYILKHNYNIYADRIKRKSNEQWTSST